MTCRVVSGTRRARVICFHICGASTCNTCAIPYRQPERLLVWLEKNAVEQNIAVTRFLGWVQHSIKEGGGFYACNLLPQHILNGVWCGMMKKNGGGEERKSVGQGRRGVVTSFHHKQTASQRTSSNGGRYANTAANSSRGNSFM